MDNDSIASMLQQAGIKATSNRIIILRTLLKAHKPLSLKDLETILDTIDKSSIFRVLTLFVDHHLLHTVEDGNGVTRYEHCHASADGFDSDIHAHFFCQKCGEVYCLDSMTMPLPVMPDGFQPHTVNYMFKGICPKCQTK